MPKPQSSVEAPAVPRLQEKYEKEVLPHLSEKLGRDEPACVAAS